MNFAKEGVIIYNRKKFNNPQYISYMLKLDSLILIVYILIKYRVSNKKSSHVDGIKISSQLG